MTPNTNKKNNKPNKWSKKIEKRREINRKEGKVRRIIITGRSCCKRRTTKHNKTSQFALLTQYTRHRCPSRRSEGREEEVIAERSIGRERPAALIAPTNTPPRCSFPIHAQYTPLNAPHLTFLCVTSLSHRDNFQTPRRRIAGFWSVFPVTNVEISLISHQKRKKTPP